jgi:hypothetical protein
MEVACQILNSMDSIRFRLAIVVGTVFLISGCASRTMSQRARDPVGYQTALTTGVCHIHNCAMKLTKAPVRDDPVFAVEQNWYWHTQKTDGCVVIALGNAAGQIWVCWKCEKDAPLFVQPMCHPPMSHSELTRALPRRSF